MNLLGLKFYGNPLYDWVVAFFITIGLALLFYLVQRLLMRRLSALAAKTATRLDDYVLEIVSHTRFLFLLIMAAYLGLQFLELPPKPARFVTHGALIALMLQAAFWGNRLVVLWLAEYLKRHRDTDAAGATTMSILGFIARAVLWSVILLMILDNLGFNITALVASLGIGGIAAALAVQNILGDIFASLSIALDKPFVIGDFIVIDDTMGTVEHIGLKATHLRSLSGERIIFSNADLLKGRLRNYKHLVERRAVFGFGVTYQTPHEKLARIPGMVREIVEAQAKTRFDRAHFKEYGDSSLNFEVVYIVQDPNYNLYMDIRQAVNLALFSRFQQEGIEFAYPTRTLHISRAADRGASEKFP